VGDANAKRRDLEKTYAAAYKTLWLSTVVAVILVGAGAVAWIIYQIAKQLRTLKTGKEEKKVANPPQYANPKYTAKEMLTAIEAAKTINELKDAIEKYFPGSVNNLVYGMGQVIETSKQLNGDTQTLAIIQGIIEEIRTSWEENRSTSELIILLSKYSQTWLIRFIGLNLRIMQKTRSCRRRKESRNHKNWRFGD